MSESREKGFIRYLQGKGHSKRTIGGYIRSVELLNNWSEEEQLELENLTYTDVLAWINKRKERRTSQGTLHKYLIGVRHYYQWLWEEGEITTNPALNIKLKGTDKTRDYDILSGVELEQFYHRFIGRELPEDRPGKLKHQRDDVMTGLLVFQGLRSSELIYLKPKDIKLREGTMDVPGGRKSNERTLTLEAHQILGMQEYLTTTRPEILKYTGKESEKLFVSIGTSKQLYNTLHKLAGEIRKTEPRIRELQQIRASVVVRWLKTHNLRKVQYMAGHRYISSTEKYRRHDMEDLREELTRSYPEL